MNLDNGESNPRNNANPIFNNPLIAGKIEEKEHVDGSGNDLSMLMLDQYDEGQDRHLSAREDWK